MSYTGYNTRFFFSFKSRSGREFRIDIKKQGYTGTATKRPLGQSPVLKRESGDNGVYGTSLSIYAECQTDGEFAELYTSDAREYLVILSLVSGNTTTPIWHGFITPELYAQPEVAPPYDVQIVATDGLGELKLYNFATAGRVSLLTHLCSILAHSGLDASASDIIVVSSLACTTHSISASAMLSSIYVELDYLAGEATYYDVLVKILTSLHMSITRYADKWVLYRESDIAVSSGSIAAFTGSGTATTLPAADYGSMQTETWWPVGRVDSEVVPAKNYIGTAYPFVLRESMLTNPNLTSGTGWTYPAPSVHNQHHYVTWDMPPYVALLYNSQAGSVDIYQDIAVEQSSVPSTLRILTLNDSNNGGNTYEVQFQVILTGNQTRYLKVKNGKYTWETSSQTNSLKLNVVQWNVFTSIDTSVFNESFIHIPSFPEAGTLRVKFISKRGIFEEQDCGFYLGGAFLLQNTVPGYKDAIVINNDARGSAGDTDLAFGDSQYVANAVKNIQNILTNSSGVATAAWATSKFTGVFLSVISMDYALGVALPRLKAKGTMNVPVNGSIPFCFVNPDNISMLIISSDWKLCDDDVTVELLSLPAASLEITSSTITKMTEAEAQSAGGAGGGSSSGSGGAGGGTVVTDPLFEELESEITGQTYGAKSLYDLYIIQQEADEQEETEEILKNISEILRHLSLQVLNAGTANEETIIVADITFASQKGIVAGGIAGGGGGTSGGSLETLADVTLSNKANGDILRYNALTSHWENCPLSLALADLSNVSSTAPTDGQALVWDNANSVWKPGTVSGGSVTVVNKAANIGTSLTTIATVGGTDITAKITHQTVTLASGTNDGTLKLTTAAGTTDNIAVKGITATKISHWESAYSNMGYADKDTNGNNLATQTWVTNKGYLTSIPAATADALGGIKIGYSESNSGSASNRNYAVKLSSNKAYVNVPWEAYSLPLAASGTRGGIKIGYSESNSGSASNRNYAVKLSSEKAYVNVPWEAYSHPTGGANTTITAANGKVLSAITVNNLGHVTSVSSKTLVAEDIPDLSGSYLPISGGTLTGDLRLKDANYGQTLYFGNGSYCYLSEDTDDHLKIYARYGIDILTSSTSYAVNIGSSSAATPMTVFGHLTVGSDASTSACKTLTLYGRTTSSNPALSIYGVVNADTSYRTDIYRDSTALKLTSSVAVTGNITATGAITAGSASDRRLKKDIKSIDINSAAEVLAHLHPVRFAWNDIAKELGELSGPSCGFLADEYLTVIPSAGRKIWGEYDAIDYNQSIPYLVAGWQQQNMRIRILEGEISALKQEICQMRRKANVV